MELHLAAREAVRVRMRPIFMTSMTTAIGMLPLALGSGVGMELYSGLGVAVVGGMALSTLFTLILIPLLFATALEFRGWLSGVVSRFLRGAPSAANLTPVRVDKAGR